MKLLMTRNLKAPALVLHSRPVGENHRGLTLLVSGEGLIRPLAFGAQGRRSPLRSSAVPYNTGTAELHYDGVHDRWRLMSFDPEDTHDGLRENLDRFYTASSWAEILLRTHGSGAESADTFVLVSTALSMLSIAGPVDLRRLNIGFLWKFLEIEGVLPDLERCSRCGTPLPPAGCTDGVCYMDDGQLAGPECADRNRPALPDGSRRWLAGLAGRPLEEFLRIGLSPDAQKAAETWLLTLVQVLLERPLLSLSAAGVRRN